jgi:hypothetical protein
MTMEDLKHLNVLPDPYDPESLRLDQSFVETSGVKKLLTTVPVRKPNNQDFVRVHPDEAYRLTAAIIELKDDREVYLVLPHVAHQLPGECSPVVLYTAINRQGATFLWPQPTLVAQLSHARQRRRNVATCVLLGHRAQH